MGSDLVIITDGDLNMGGRETTAKGTHYLVLSWKHLIDVHQKKLCQRRKESLEGACY